MIPAPLVQLLRQQQAAGFPDLAGARASILLPLSDRLLTRVLAELLPASAPVRDVELQASPGGRFTARLRIARAAFLPPVTLSFAIVEQPQLPAHPVLGLRLLSTALMAFAGPAAKFLDVLPRGVTLDGDRINVNLGTLLAEQGLAEHLRYLTRLQVNTEEGRFIVDLESGT